MRIRKAEEKDIPRIMELLGQVLELHAEIRPDIFIPGTTKYTVTELAELLKQEDKPVYLAVNDEDVCRGYAFCQLKEQDFSTNMVQFKSLFIDDLCVDKDARGQHIGEYLFEYVKQELSKCLYLSPGRFDKWNPYEIKTKYEYKDKKFLNEQLCDGWNISCENPENCRSLCPPALKRCML